MALGLGLRARGSGELIAIDPQSGDDVRFEELRANVDRAGVAPFVRLIRETSHAARPQVPDGSVDLLFVDGSHEYADVVTDVEDWTPALAPGAIVAFNDPFWSGVGRVLDERATVRDTALRSPTLVANTLFFLHRPGSTWTDQDEAARQNLAKVLRFGRRWLSLQFRISLSRFVPRPLKSPAVLGMAAVVRPRLREGLGQPRRWQEGRFPPIRSAGS